jgi:Na+-translocating ferredoxin:NAD+ oxidoreductase subunit G
MNKSIQMVVVLTLISLLSGLALGGLHGLTYELAQNNILKFKKIPAVADIYEVAAGKLPPAEREALEEGLLAEKRFVDLGDGEPVLFFVIRKDGEPFAVALEDYGQGFGGELGVMIGVELESGNLVGVGITTMMETPGVGTKVREKSFLKQFHGMNKETVFKVRKDGGGIDAVSGATISCRAVAQGIELAHAFYTEHREAILTAIDVVPGGAE